MRLPVLLLSLAMTAAAAEIPQGTHVLLRLVNSIDTRTAREGDYVYMRTSSPIVANGQILVPADSYVQGVVSKVTRSGKVRGRAELGVRIEDPYAGQRRDDPSHAPSGLGGCRGHGPAGESFE